MTQMEELGEGRGWGGTNKGSKRTTVFAHTPPPPLMFVEVAEIFTRRLTRLA